MFQRFPISNVIDDKTSDKWSPDCQIYGVDRVATLASLSYEDADVIAWKRLSDSRENAKVKPRENVAGGKSPALPSFLPFYFRILEPGTNQHYRQTIEW